MENYFVPPTSQAAPAVAIAGGPRKPPSWLHWAIVVGTVIGIQPAIVEAHPEVLGLVAVLCLAPAFYSVGRWLYWWGRKGWRDQIINHFSGSRNHPHG
jgi:hypothetical protein